LVGTPSVGDCTVTISANVTTTSVTWGYANTAPCGKSKTGVGT
jgi:hypothetical protein